MFVSPGYRPWRSGALAALLALGLSSLTQPLAAAEAPRLVPANPDIGVVVSDRYLEQGNYRVPIDLQAFVADADGDPITFAISQPLGLGSVLDHGRGFVTYLASAELFDQRTADPSFEFTAFGAGAESFVRGRIVLTGATGIGSGAVLGVPDHGWTQPRRAVVLDVLANDANATQVASVTQGARGTVAIDAATQRLVYTPAASAGAGDVDSFSYVPRAGAGGATGSATAVSISYESLTPVVADTFAGSGSAINGRVAEIPANGTVAWSADAGWQRTTRSGLDVAVVNGAGGCGGGSVCYGASVPFVLRDLPGPSFYVEARLKVAGADWVALALSHGDGNPFTNGDLWVGLRATGAVFVNTRPGANLVPDFGLPGFDPLAFHTLRLGFEDFGSVSVWLDGVRVVDRVEYHDPANAISPYYTVTRAGLFAFVPANVANDVQVDRFEVSQGVSQAPEVQVLDPYDGIPLEPGTTPTVGNTVTVPSNLSPLVGRYFVVEIPVVNLGDEDLEIQAVSASPGWEAVEGQLPLIVPPGIGSAGRLRMQLDTETAGTYSSLVTLSTTDPDLPAFPFFLVGTVSANPVPDNPLSIVVHPTPTTVDADAPTPVFLRCKSSGGTAANSFRWLIDGGDILGGEATVHPPPFPAGCAVPANESQTRYSCLEIFNRNTHAYSCKVFYGPPGNPTDQATSNPALVTFQSLVFRQHPLPLTVSEGEAGSLFVNADTNGAPLAYRWQKDCVNLADGAHVNGSQAAQLSLLDTLPNQAGVYQAFASNSAGPLVLTRASNPAVVTVLPRNTQRFVGDTFQNLGPNRLVGNNLVGARTEFGRKTWATLLGRPTPVFGYQHLTNPALPPGLPPEYGASFLFTAQPFSLAEPIAFDADVDLGSLQSLTLSFYSIDANGVYQPQVELLLVDPQEDGAWQINGSAVPSSLLLPTVNGFTLEYRQDTLTWRVLVNGVPVGSTHSLPAKLDIDAAGFGFRPDKNATTSSVRIYRLGTSPNGELPGTAETLFYDAFDPDPPSRAEGGTLIGTFPDRGVRTWQGGSVKVDQGAAVNSVADPVTNGTTAFLGMGGTHVYQRLAVEALVDLRDAESASIGFAGATTGAFESLGRLWLKLVPQRTSGQITGVQTTFRGYWNNQQNLLDTDVSPEVTPDGRYLVRIELDRVSQSMRAYLNGVPLSPWIYLNGNTLSFNLAGFQLEKKVGGAAPYRLAVESFRVLEPPSSVHLQNLVSSCPSP
jgi:hypothetical protein